jgi:predicted AAA+ superfamily ATPase
MADEGLPFLLLGYIEGLTVFSALKKNRLLRSFREFLSVFHRISNGVFSTDVLELLEAWAAFVDAFNRNKPFSEWYVKIASLAVKSDNAFTRKAELLDYKAIAPGLCGAARMDLHRLGLLAELDLELVGSLVADLLGSAGLEDAGNAVRNESLFLSVREKKNPLAGKLRRLFPAGKDWGASLPAFAAHIRKNGAGLLGAYPCFVWSGRLVPADHPDPVRLSGLICYEDQRAVVIANTEAFLKGRRVNNLLLYGDRGTGKSATVKAVCAEYAERGLRLVELKKKDLLSLPRIMEKLGSRALHFVLFVDDLSFEEAGASFTELKALLEGGVETRPDNVVIYATSNRRHLVKERRSDRPGAQLSLAEEGAEVRAFDTMQEQFSLADRFGVTLVFLSPSQDEYLKIAEFLGEARGLFDLAARDAFRGNALRWERWFNGRSPRTAVQFVDWAGSGAKFPWE